MWWPTSLAASAGLFVGLVAGVVLGRLHARGRVARLAAGARELANGNLAHRVIMEGDDDAADAAEALNVLADAVQAERDLATSRASAYRRLIANVSHDLRTPITSVAGYVDALRRGLGEEPQRYLDVIAEKADELSHLTDDLFYAARIQAGDLDLRCERLDLAEVVRRSILGFEPQLAATGARVDVEIPDVECPVDGDVHALTRVLSNLVTNSLRHATGMSVFAVEMADSDGRYTVRLSNDGPPLPPDAQRLFERGVAGSASGAGLGLSIARELAEMMGADVRAETGIESGAVFTLAFPKGLQFRES